MDRTKAMFRFLNGNVRDLLDFSIILLGMAFILHCQIDVATMLIIFSYRGNILSISSNIESFLENLTKFNLSAKRIFEVIDGEVFPKETFGEKHLEKVSGHIEFKNVSFSYIKYRF